MSTIDSISDSLDCIYSHLQSEFIGSLGYKTIFNIIWYDEKKRELIWIDSFLKILGIASNWKTDKSSVSWIGNACKMSNRIKYNFGFLFKEKRQICYKIHSGYTSLDSNWIFIPYFYFWKRKQKLFKIMRVFAENLELVLKRANKRDQNGRSKTSILRSRSPEC